ncbi:5-methyltetrahydropteroyltriglutamate--homocysteine S-methyltransferase [Jeotgalibaca sp. A127]|uniref:5-methyltetrahydropteroyltriglutamate-- homocysteine S-methyltransferase n=1 Tax=Jeotgalibaca sp. A127 TaxID=3457324 RepID=UPI003FCF520B
MTFTKRLTAPYRFDSVGSFLRPKRLTEAREKFKNGVISKEELRRVEDEEIIKLIKKQEAVGLKAVTDGEFRRSSWHMDFFGYLIGTEFYYPDIQTHKAHYSEEVLAESETIQKKPVNKSTGSVHLIEKLSGKNHPFIDHFKFTQEYASDNVDVKLTIPSPAQFIRELVRDYNIESTRAVYPTDKELIEGVSNAYREFLEELYEAGCRLVQLDDTSWGTVMGPISDELSDEEKAREVERREWLKELFVSVNNATITERPEDVTVTTHVCRGNYQSAWFASGGYEAVADELFVQETIDGYFLEYDNDRAGGFEPLAKVKKDSTVVLGLVTSKVGKLEDRNEIIKRIQEASRYVDLDQICLSPQCGFSSTEEGNIITEEDQWKKIELIKSIAAEVWLEV